MKYIAAILCYHWWMSQTFRHPSRQRVFIYHLCSLVNYCGGYCGGSAEILTARLKLSQVTWLKPSQWPPKESQKGTRAWPMDLSIIWLFSRIVPTRHKDLCSMVYSNAAVLPQNALPKHSPLCKALRSRRSVYRYRLSLYHKVQPSTQYWDVLRSSLALKLSVFCSSHNENETMLAIPNIALYIVSELTRRLSPQ